MTHSDAIIQVLVSVDRMLERAMRSRADSAFSLIDAARMAIQPWLPYDEGDTNGAPDGASPPRRVAEEAAESQASTR